MLRSYSRAAGELLFVNTKLVLVSARALLYSGVTKSAVIRML